MIELDKRTNIFEKIRDIPYKFSSGLDNSICSVKARKLGEILMEHGLECRVARCRFRWDQLGIPNDIVSLLSESSVPEEVNHTYLRVRVPETDNFVDVDATWDNKLSPTLDIASWDGLNDTLIAVPTKVFHEVKDSSDNFITPDQIEPTKIPENDIFLNALNEWFVKIRERSDL